MARCRYIPLRTPYTQLYVHCVWATWDRLPLITARIDQPVYASVQSKYQEMNCPIIALGGIPDHVHLLFRFPTTITAAEVTKEVKGASSHLVTHQVDGKEFFKWQ